MVVIERQKTYLKWKDTKEINGYLRFGVGVKTKINSSSWILEDYKSARTERKARGYYRVIHEIGKEIKVKN